MRIAMVAALFLFAACKKDVAPTATATATASAPAPSVDEQKVTVDDQGYHPATVKAAAGKPLRLVFTRTSEFGCGQELVFPTLDIKKELPLNTAVAIEIKVPATGEVKFTCGMGMYEGKIVVN